VRLGRDASPYLVQFEGGVGEVGRQAEERSLVILLGDCFVVHRIGFGWMVGRGEVWLLKVTIGYCTVTKGY
jgi:hypothetical protein